MSQFKNLFDATINLNVNPTGSQEQTNYDNALLIYNKYLKSIIPVYSTTYSGSVSNVTTSGIYKILKFINTGTSNITTKKATKIYYVVVGGGGSGGCANTSSYTTYGAGGGAGGYINSGYFIQNANTTITYTMTIGSGGFAVGTALNGSNGLVSSVASTIFNVTSAGGAGGYGDSIFNATTSETLGLGSLGLFGVTELNPGSRDGGKNNNNITDMTDGYTLQIHPSYQIRLGGGGGGGGMLVLPNTVVPNNSGWGGGVGGYLLSTTTTRLPTSGTNSTGAGGGGSRPYTTNASGNLARGGSGVVLFFYVDDLVNSSVTNNTTMSNAIETLAISSGSYRTSLLNNFVFNPLANLEYVNVNLTATINSLTTTNSLSTYMKIQRIKQKLFYSYLPNGAPGRFTIDYNLDSSLSTMYTATGHNFLFNPYTSNTFSIYYSLLNIVNLPTIPNRIYTFNFYSISRYNAHNTIFNPSTISVNSVSIPLNGISNITFPTTNSYMTQKISIISSPTLPISYFAYTTVQGINIDNIILPSI